MQVTTEWKRTRFVFAKSASEAIGAARGRSACIVADAPYVWRLMQDGRDKLAAALSRFAPGKRTVMTALQVFKSAGPDAFMREVLASDVCVRFTDVRYETTAFAVWQKVVRIPRKCAVTGESTEFLSKHVRDDAGFRRLFALFLRSDDIVTDMNASFQVGIDAATFSDARHARLHKLRRTLASVPHADAASEIARRYARCVDVQARKYARAAGECERADAWDAAFAALRRWYTIAKCLAMARHTRTVVVVSADPHVARGLREMCARYA